LNANDRIASNPETVAGHGGARNFKVPNENVEPSAADALEIEAAAKLRLADEYDAAIERNEIGSHEGDRTGKFPDEKLALATEIVDPKLAYQARQIRDAEEANPGIVRRTLDAALEAGEQPTLANIRATSQPHSLCR